MHVTQNWPNLEKRPPSLQFSSKVSDFFFVKDLTNRLLLLLFVSFWEHTFFARMWRLKNGWPLSAPSSAYFYHPQFLKKKFGESWNHTAFIKKKFEKFWWKLKEYKQYLQPMGCRRPPQGPLGLTKFDSLPLLVGTGFFVKFHPFFGKLFFWIDAKIVHIYKIDDFTWIEKDV